MTARNPSPPSRYVQSETMRQAVLDLVHANPGISGSEIIKHVGGDGCTVNSRLKGMCDLGEMKRTPVVINTRNVRGHVRKIATYAYTALVEKTISAETVRRMAENERKPYRPRDKPQTQRQEAQKLMKETKKPWITRNIDPDRPPLKDQGGQGAVERRVVIGSTLA